MANLSITTICNRQCTYCFASDSRKESGEQHMEESIYIDSLEYLSRSNFTQVRLLGGEPTLHPQFIKFVKTALERDLTIMLFTNGIINDDILDFLASVPENKLDILLNTIPPDEYNPEGLLQQHKTMRMLGKRIIPGTTIYSPRQQFEYLISLVNTFNLKKKIRLGLSHPVLSTHNSFLHPKQYRNIGNRIVELKKKASRENIAIGFDCGFVPCMFNPSDLPLLKEELKKTGTCCHPIIDLLSDGTFISCYPLNNLHKVQLNPLITAEDLISEFKTVLMPYETTGIYPHCTSCPIFKSKCNGGCMAFRIQRFMTSHP